MRQELQQQANDDITVLCSAEMSFLHMQKKKKKNIKDNIFQLKY